MSVEGGGKKEIHQITFVKVPWGHDLLKLPYPTGDRARVTIPFMPNSPVSAQNPSP